MALSQRSYLRLSVRYWHRKVSEANGPRVPAILEGWHTGWWQDYRGNYPDTFAITEPQACCSKPGQWEEKQSLLIAWTGNFGEVVANIIRYARLNTEVTIAHDGDYALSQFKLEMQRNGVETSGLKYEQLPVQSLWMRDYGHSRSRQRHLELCGSSLLPR